MTTGDLLRRLLGAHASRDDEAFRSAAFELIQDERSKNHRLLADDLERLIRSQRASRRPTISPRQPAVAGDLATTPRDRDRGLSLLRIERPSVGWHRLILPDREVSRLRRVVDEHKRSELLERAGLGPTRRLLFYGPPGSGKTLAAEVIASALDYPLAVVRFDAIVSSLLGETAANLVKVFDYIDDARVVVLFDEFDAIAKERGDASEHGELRRVVNALLQLMDAYKGQSILIAATNHESLLDSAIWRRFEVVIQFPVPARQDRVLMLRTFLRGHDFDERGVESLADKTNGASGSDLELIAISAARAAALSLSSSITRDALETALVDYRDRLRTTSSNGSTPDG